MGRQKISEKINNDQKIFQFHDIYKPTNSSKSMKPNHKKHEKNCKAHSTQTV